MVILLLHKEISLSLASLVVISHLDPQKGEGVKLYKWTGMVTLSILDYLKVLLKKVERGEKVAFNHHLHQQRRNNSKSILHPEHRINYTGTAVLHTNHFCHTKLGRYQ